MAKLGAMRAWQACQTINPEHPEYVAAQIEAMYKTLKSLLWDLRQHAIPNDLSELEIVVNAIEKRE